MPKTDPPRTVAPAHDGSAGDAAAALPRPLSAAAPENVPRGLSVPGCVENAASSSIAVGLVASPVVADIASPSDRWASAGEAVGGAAIAAPNSGSAPRSPVDTAVAPSSPPALHIDHAQKDGPTMGSAGADAASAVSPPSSVASEAAAVSLESDSDVSFGVRPSSQQADPAIEAVGVVASVPPLDAPSVAAPQLMQPLEPPRKRALPPSVAALLFRRPKASAHEGAPSFGRGEAGRAASAAGGKRRRPDEGRSAAADTAAPPTLPPPTTTAASPTAVAAAAAAAPLAPPPPLNVTDASTGRGPEYLSREPEPEESGRGIVPEPQPALQKSTEELIFSFAVDSPDRCVGAQFPVLRPFVYRPPIVGRYDPRSIPLSRIECSADVVIRDSPWGRTAYARHFIPRGQWLGWCVPKRAGASMSRQ